MVDRVIPCLFGIGRRRYGFHQGSLVQHAIYKLGSQPCSRRCGSRESKSTTCAKPHSCGSALHQTPACPEICASILIAQWCSGLADGLRIASQALLKPVQLDLFRPQLSRIETPVRMPQQRVGPFNDDAIGRPAKELAGLFGIRGCKRHLAIGELFVIHFMNRLSYSTRGRHAVVTFTGWLLRLSSERFRQG